MYASICICKANNSGHKIYVTKYFIKCKVPTVLKNLVIKGTAKTIAPIEGCTSYHF